MEDSERLTESLIQIASETQRFEKIVVKILQKLDIDEQSKYSSQLNWFIKRVTKALEQAGLSCVNVENQVYDPGMAVTPLNLDEFDAEDTLVVAQMIEPIVMKGTAVAKQGTVLLGRAK